MITDKAIPILLVDDDPIFLSTLCATLENEPGEWDIYEATTVKEALFIMTLNKIDIAVLDINLPDGSALDIIREANQIPCMLSTQDVNNPTFLSIFNNILIKENLVGYITKPIQRGVIWSIRAGVQIGNERKAHNLVVAEATAAQENNCHLIAQNLHDSMGAHLTQLNWIINRIKASQKTDQESAKNKEVIKLCDQAKDFVNNSYREVSLAIAQLRPEMISVAGLIQGIELMIDQWAEAAPSVRFERYFDKGINLIDNRKTSVIYHIVQEGITNAMKHSKPIFVKTEMRCFANNLQITIHTQGEVEIKDHYALTILRERTSSLGGNLQFSCTKKHGKSLLIINIPN